jgi:hypothetical protein
MGGAFSYRPVDSQRLVAELIPEISGGLGHHLWLRDHMGLRIDISSRWIPNNASVDLQVIFVWSGRPGLRDISPSSVDSRSAATWNEASQWTKWLSSPANRASDNPASILKREKN